MKSKGSKGAKGKTVGFVCPRCGYMTTSETLYFSHAMAHGRALPLPVVSGGAGKAVAKAKVAEPVTVTKTVVKPAEKVEKVTIRFNLDRETPGTFVYKEQGEKDKHVVGTLYVRKESKLAGRKILTVTVEG